MNQGHGIRVARLPRLALGTLAAALLTAGLTGLTAPAAQSAPVVTTAKTFTACVNKKSGETRMLVTKKARKKKCGKGWRKVSWSGAARPGTPGAPGSPGAGGAAGGRGPLGELVVYDASGEAIGPLLGTENLAAPFPAYRVRTSGGDYTYTVSGLVVPNSFSPIFEFQPYFKGAACAGTPYVLATDPADVSDALAAAGGSTRLVYRSSGPSGLGTPLAYRVPTGAVAETAVGIEVSSYGESGVCASDGIQPAGTLIPLQSVTPAPTDRTGPLSLQ